MKRVGFRGSGWAQLALGSVLLTMLFPASLAADGFKDSEDGYFDVSSFLDRPYGFVPVISPITEPAVGYGATLALVFVKKVKSEPGQPPIRPNIGAVGAARTQNGSRAAFAAASNSWMKGRVRTIFGAARGDINLTFYGLKPGTSPGEGGIDYNVDVKGGMVGGSYQLGQSGWWIGARYALSSVDATLRRDDPDAAPNLPEPEFDLRLGALVPRLTLDTRNNVFTPTKGNYIDLGVPLFRDTWGSDRDFTKASLTGMWFHPVHETLFFGIRGTANYSSGETPFYLKPGIVLRGVEAIRYQGNRTAEVEAELRWQFDPRFSLVGFAGAGEARNDTRRNSSSETVFSGGGGFRYLVARRYGIHMGLDVGFGPDGPILYVIFGSAWNRE